MKMPMSVLRELILLAEYVIFFGTETTKAIAYL